MIAAQIPELLASRFVEFPVPLIDALTGPAPGGLGLLGADELVYYAPAQSNGDFTQLVAALQGVAPALQAESQRNLGHLTRAYDYLKLVVKEANMTVAKEHVS